jgi:hypothetical protein
MAWLRAKQFPGTIAFKRHPVQPWVAVSLATAAVKLEALPVFRKLAIHETSLVSGQI